LAGRYPPRCYSAGCGCLALPRTVLFRPRDLNGVLSDEPRFRTFASRFRGRRRSQFRRRSQSLKPHRGRWLADIFPRAALRGPDGGIRGIRWLSFPPRSGLPGHLWDGLGPKASLSGCVTRMGARNSLGKAPNAPPQMRAPPSDCYRSGAPRRAGPLKGSARNRGHPVEAAFGRSPGRQRECREKVSSHRLPPRHG
jgi:hypothetical protein